MGLKNLQRGSRMEIPEQDNSINNLINKYHESKTELPRPHLGASLLGHSCDRWLWLSFRWAVQPTFNGRILRLFRRGHNEEATIISDLRAIGLKIKNNASQERVDFGSFVSGSLDAIIEYGVPEAPNKKHIAEFKTHSKKSFDSLLKDGVQKSKPMHYVQMQVYMLGTKIDRALYYAVCKDNDQIYTERVRFDKEFAEKYINRGKAVALSERMPPPVSTDASWYECKMCDAHEFCHDTKTTKHVNCRTCAHSTPTPESTFYCAKWESDIPTEHQYEGCEYHVLHPDLVPWQMAESDNQWQAVYIINNRKVKNGAPDFDCYASKEILANPIACTEPDEFMIQTRKEGGSITG